MSVIVPDATTCAILIYQFQATLSRAFLSLFSSEKKTHSNWNFYKMIINHCSLRWCAASKTPSPDKPVNFFYQMSLRNREHSWATMPTHGLWARASNWMSKLRFKRFQFCNYLDQQWIANWETNNVEPKIIIRVFRDNFSRSNNQFAISLALSRYTRETVAANANNSSPCRLGRRSSCIRMLIINLTVKCRKAQSNFAATKLEYTVLSVTKHLLQSILGWVEQWRHVSIYFSVTNSKLQFY